MDLSLLINKKLLSSSLSGISGVGVGGWFAHESNNPSIHSKLVYEGFKYEPAILKSDSLKITPKQASGGGKIFFPFVNLQDGCLKRLFPSLSIGENVEINAAVVDTSSRFSPTTGTHASSLKITGCTVMKLFTSNSGTRKFVFESETAVKNDKTGIVVRGSSKNVKLTNDSKDESKLVLQYTVLFLENTSNVWSIKWGVILSEEADNNNSQIKQVVIKSPDGSINKTFKTITGGSSDSETWKEQNYSGIWEESKDNNGSTVFEKVIVAEDKNKASILGNNGDNFGGMFNSGTYLLSEYIYNGREDVKKWTPQSTDIKGYLNDWFKPFKGKKGKWRDCDSKSREKNVSNDTKELLKAICYVKKTA